MFFIYGILSTVLFIVILPCWLIAGVFKPKLIAGFKAKCGFYGASITTLTLPLTSHKTILNRFVRGKGCFHYEQKPASN